MTIKILYLIQRRLPYSSALSHNYYEDAETEDKFYTPEEIIQHSVTTCKQFVHKSEEALIESNGGLSRPDVVVMLEKYHSGIRSCECPAHRAFRASSDVEFCDRLGRLIATPPMLTDHWGCELAETLLPFMFKKVGLGMSVQKSGPGSPYTVNFILQMPSGKAYHFTGYPDFSVNSKLSGCVLRYSMKGIGKQGFKKSCLAAIILHKDKTAQVAVAKLDTRQKSDQSCGAVTFQLMERVEPLDLTVPAELQIFARLLGRALKQAELDPGSE